MLVRFLIVLCIAALVAGCGPRRGATKVAPRKTTVAVRPVPLPPVQPKLAPPIPTHSARLPDTITKVEEAAAADASMAAHNRQQARMELEKSYQRTALSDEQIERQQAAAAALIAGDTREALEQLRALNQELERGAEDYKVRPNDTLWHIASRPEVYRNGYLWPLIWEANRDELRSPNRVFPGMVLQIRRHPTLDEVTRALAYSKEQAAAQVRIGVIREVVPAGGD